MDIQAGDQVLVKRGAVYRVVAVGNKQSVTCEVLAVHGDEVEIRTMAPCPRGLSRPSSDSGLIAALAASV